MVDRKPTFQVRTACSMTTEPESMDRRGGGHWDSDLLFVVVMPLLKLGIFIPDCR
jgi:hypothetical protein